MILFYTDFETGKTNVAAQGVVCDAHKYIALAFIASILIKGIIYLCKKTKT